MKQEKPLVSILIPSFNHSLYIQDCIESVISQDYENIELIIIDDGSTDDSIVKISSKAERCKEKFVRFEFRCRINKGLSETINEAIQWSQGVYFSAIASDDLLYSNKTSVLVSHMEKESYDVAGIFGGCDLIDQFGSVMKCQIPPVVYPTFDDIILLKYNIIAPSQLLRLTALRDVGCYPAGLYIEDWYMWLMLTSKGYRLKLIPDILVQYRKHYSNASKKKSMIESKKIVLSYFKDHELYFHAMALSYISAAVYLSFYSKIKTIYYIAKAIYFDSKIIFTKDMMVSILALPIPVFLMRFFFKAQMQLQSSNTFRKFIIPIEK